MLPFTLIVFYLTFTILLHVIFQEPLTAALFIIGAAVAVGGVAGWLWATLDELAASQERTIRLLERWESDRKNH